MKIKRLEERVEYGRGIDWTGMQVEQRRAAKRDQLAQEQHEARGRERAAAEGRAW